MKFSAPDYLILIVENLNRSIEFYSGILGLELSHRTEGYAQFRTGGTRLALYTREAMSVTLGLDLYPPKPVSPGFEIGFKVENVDAAFSELANRGVPVQMTPTDRPWGQRTAYFRDPDGHLIEIAQDISRPDSNGQSG